MAENVAQMGNATVRRITLHGRPAIHKQDVTRVELCFYKYAAPELSSQGLAVPLVFELDMAARDLALEYIPYAITQYELRDNIAFIQMLTALHTSPLTYRYPLHHHSWYEKAQDITCQQLNLSAAARSALQRIKAASDALFYPAGMISGDSNAGNWARRAGGDIVLFDWKRFGMGSPAIDLAPLIKGMGTAADYYALAECYCRINRRYRVEALSRAIAISKAWIVTQVMKLLYIRQKAALSLYTEWYKNNLPDWLSQVSRLI